MTPEQMVAAVLRDCVRNMPDPDRENIEKAIAELKEWLVTKGEAGRMAVGVVGAELACEES